MRRSNRTFLLVAAFLLVVPAVGASCELATALCELGASAATDVQMPPCHGIAEDMAQGRGKAAMDCCSIQEPSESPPAAFLERSERLTATITHGAPSTAVTIPATAEGAPPKALTGYDSALGRYVLFSAYLL